MRLAKRNNKAVTHFELLMVLVIIAVVIAISQANFSIILRNMRVKADVKTSLAILESIRLEHISDNYGTFDILENSGEYIDYENLKIQRYKSGNDMKMYIVARVDAEIGTRYAILYMTKDGEQVSRIAGKAYLIEENDTKFRVNKKSLVRIKPELSASGNVEYAFDDVNYQEVTKQAASEREEESSEKEKHLNRAENRKNE
jgi:Tfp pilus assembly protein PilE